MITILSFIAKKEDKLMFCEVSYDLMTKEAVYSSFDSNCNKVEQKKYKSIVIPSCNYQADLSYALNHGYKVKINPKV